MKKRFITLVIAGIALALPALAGEEEDRVRDVEDYLSRIKDKLDGTAGKSSTGDLDYAIEHADKVKEYSEKLRSLPAQNEPGKTMGSYYPDYVYKFKESLKNLKFMKEAQIRQAEERLAERCQEADKYLRSFINGYVEKKDKAEGRRGLIVIPDEAEKIGRTYGDELKRMEDKHREVQSWRSYAKVFSDSHGRWSDVRSKLHDSVDYTWDRWNKRLEDSRYCQQLAKGKENPIVIDALQKLGLHTTLMDTMYRDLRKRYVEWRKELNSFRAGALQDARELKDLFCYKLDWESRADQVANKYASELRPKWDLLFSERDKMLNASDLLINMGADNAAKLKRLIVQSWDKVEPIKDGELKGANHPMIRAHIEKGKSEHNSRQSGCDMKETLIDSSYCTNPHPDRKDCKLDCVRGCIIIEIKPNNVAEIEMGGKQVAAYQKAFDEIWKQKNGPRDGKQSEMFTMNSGRYAHLQKCVSGSAGSYSFRTETFLETYGFCPGDPAVYFGSRDPIPTEEPPEKPIE